MSERETCPTQFPVGVPEWLIRVFSQRRDLIVDLFMGSGATAIAAMKTDRHWIGFERDSGYARKLGNLAHVVVNIARRRIKEAREAPGPCPRPVTDAGLRSVRPVSTQLPIAWGQPADRSGPMAARSQGVLAILRQGELDAVHLSGSEAAGMGAGEDAMLGRVETAIRMLQDAGHAAR